MTRPNRHRIQRQIIDLTIGDTVEGAAVHQALGRPFWERAVPELERVFDQAVGPDELLQVERLELDLGAMSGGEWVSEFRRRLVAELTRTLAQFTAAPEAPEERRASRRPPEKWRLFLFFLAHGRLPWWSAAPESWNGLLSNATEADWKTLRETVVSDPRVRSRLVHSVDHEFLERAIAAWSSVPEAARVMAQLTPKHLAGEARWKWRREFWILLLDWVATSRFRSPYDGPRLVAELIALRHTFDSHDGGQPRSFHPAPDDSAKRGGRSATFEEGVLPEPWLGWFASQDGSVPPEQGLTEGQTGTDERKRRVPAGTPAPAGSSKDRVREEEEEEAIYLPGAGAILIHPFLEHLFRGCGLLEGRAFRDAEARRRAVHLIGFLTFGILDVPEYDLVLAKALCGVDLEEPLEPVPLEDEDIASCEALLRAILAHWTALRSSSPQWLREQFFLREGKLQRVDSGWLLTIERRAQDVLLARLPWGFGVVATPWLSERIFVHWIE